MAKSIRSKFKKAMKRIRAQKEAPQVAKRVSKLNHKLHLCAEGGIGKLPTQDPPTEFGFKHPQHIKGQRVTLAKPTTSFHGKSTKTAHPQRRMGNFVTQEGDPNHEMGADVEVDAEQFTINGHAAAGKQLSAQDFMRMATVIGDDEEEEDEAAVEAPEKIKSMRKEKGDVEGNTKMKSTRRQRLVSTSKKNKK